MADDNDGSMKAARVVMLSSVETIYPRIVNEARALAEAGHEVVVVAQGPGPGEATGVAIERVEIGLGLAARLRRRAAGSLARGLSGYQRAFRDHALGLEPDVVHVHNLPLLAAGVSVKRETGAALVYDMHEFYPEQTGLDRSVQKRLRAEERRLIGEADLRLTVNPLLAAAISSVYGGLEIETLQLAVDAPVDLHRRRWNLLREALGIAADRYVLLYQGWLNPMRNLRALIEAMERVQAPVELVFMGYGDLDRTGPATVHFLDARPQDEYLRWSASADVGVIQIPARLGLNERLSSTMKLYEYIAARLPILTNELPFVRGVVVENGFGVAADLESVEGIGRALDTFPFDRLAEFRQNLAERGEAFSWAAERPKLLELYGRLVSRKG